VSVASHVYAVAARYRRAWLAGHPSRVRRLDRPVVSVGSLSAGGSGKTPLAGLVARRLLEAAGHRPAILSRGYARTAPDDGVTIVSDGTRLCADLARAGDEPLMLARALPDVPVVVSPDRYLAGRVAELHLGATVHVLDDGFQHMVLARDVDLLIVDAADAERPRLLPTGRLREPLSAARHADAILVSGEGSDARAIADRLGVAEAFALTRATGAPVEETGTGPAPLKKVGRALLVSGIARPARFAADARAQGLDVAGVMAFRDHHAFTRGDIDRIAAKQRETAAEIVMTTEKDLVRLLIHRPWPFRVAVLPLNVAVEPATDFASWLTGRIVQVGARERPTA
jgi:tetraacyldisaccharide 4'-kinase